MAALIVEEDVRLQHLQHGPLREASQEESVVDTQAPLADRIDRTLVSGGATRRHDGDADPTPVPLRVIHAFRVLETLNSVDLLEKIGHRPTVERHLGQGALILLVLLQAPALEHALSRIVGQHPVEVEGDAQIRVPIVRRGVPAANPRLIASRTSASFAERKRDMRSGFMKR